MTTNDQAAAYVATTGQSLPWRLPAVIQLNEVGPRDGLQLEDAQIPTEEKVRLVDALSRTGVPAIQVTSFVRPDAVPQLADAEEVMERIERVPGVEYSVLVPNRRGLERAIPFAPDAVETMLSVTDSHSLANANRTTQQALEGVADLVELADRHGIEVVGGMATALGCPFEGRPPYDRVAWVTEKYLELGLRRVTVADTIGVADPAHVHDLLGRLMLDFPELEFALHLHDTRGLAVANTLAGIAAGVTRFDSSVGGLGGCPFAPGATGNVATEVLVHLFALLGVRTGVDLDAYLDIARQQVAALVDHPLESALARADPSWVTTAPPQRQQLDQRRTTAELRP